MGNRAVITYWDNLEPQTSEKKGIYLHWNGGRDSVEAFLAYGKLQSIKNEVGAYRVTFSLETLAWIIDNGLCLGFKKSCEIDETKNLDCDNYDNGTYLVRDWEIVGRKFLKNSEQYEYDLLEFLLGIDENMPKDARLGEEYIKANIEKVKQN